MVLGVERGIWLFSFHCLEEDVHYRSSFLAYWLYLKWIQSQTTLSSAIGIKSHEKIKYKLYPVRLKSIYFHIL